jgi:hypothetical protein
VKERRLETPRPDLVVLRIGERLASVQVHPKEAASGVVAKVAKAMAKPGLTRAQIFQGTSGKVYAYSIYSKDPSKVVREDASGRKILGRFVTGRFRPLSSGRAL